MKTYSLEDLESCLTGRTIVSVSIDVEDSGFHVVLDDGNVMVFITEGPYGVGVFRPEDKILQ